MKPFSNIAALAYFSPGFILLFLGRTNFAKVQFDIGRELKSRTMKGTSFLFREPGLVLEKR